MLNLLVRVPDVANRTAMATLRDGARVVLKDYAVAVPQSGLGQQHGNPTGDPRRPYGPVPRGAYALAALAPTPADAVPEYGTHLLAFEPQSGPALEAESFGRLVLLAYAGPSGRDLTLRRTQGGLRLTVAMVNAIVSRLSPDAELQLRVEPLDLTPRPWWAFWKPAPENVRPLSPEPPRFLVPPLDEAAMTAHVLRQGRRRRLRRYDPDTDRWIDPATSSDSTATAAGTPFESGGGRFGGAGATGGWEPESGRPTGVDSAGRIGGTVAAGAAAAAAAAALGMSAAAQRDESSDAPGDGGATGTADAGASISTSY
jgi:hypothetical protein